MTTLTAQVRKIIHQEGLAGYFWTNRYEKCRTVKCYMDGRDYEDYCDPSKSESVLRNTVLALHKWAGEQGIKIDIKMLDWGDKLFGVTVPSFIVRVPLND